MLDVKVLSPHTDTGSDYHEFVVLGDHVWRDSLGRRHRHSYRLWLVAVCNNPDCRGKALVSERSIAAAIAEQVNQG